MYIDTDFEPFKCIDPLLDGVRMFICSEDGETITGSIIGAEPASPIVRRFLDELPEQIGLAAPNIETGPTYVTRTLLDGGFGDELTVFPTRYFFPYNSLELHRSTEHFPDSYAAHRYAHSWSWPEETLTIPQRIARRLRRIWVAATERY